MSKFTMVPKKELRNILPYLGSVANITKAKLTKAGNKNSKFCVLKILFESTKKLKN